jgi:hypothetical protein
VGWALVPIWVCSMRRQPSEAACRIALAPSTLSLLMKRSREIALPNVGRLLPAEPCLPSNWRDRPCKCAMCRSWILEQLDAAATAFSKHLGAAAADFALKALTVSAWLLSPALGTLAMSVLVIKPCSSAWPMGRIVLMRSMSAALQPIGALNLPVPVESRQGVARWAGGPSPPNEDFVAKALPPRLDR